MSSMHMRLSAQNWLIIYNKWDIVGENLSGPIAQLVERSHGMGEASGSNPLGSTLRFVLAASLRASTHWGLP